MLEPCNWHGFPVLRLRFIVMRGVPEIDLLEKNIALRRYFFALVMLV